MAADVVVAGLLIAGVALELFCVLGVAVMRGALSRLHYTGPSSVGALLIALAMLVREGFSLIANKGLLIAAFFVVTAPLLAHVTARAARIRERGRLDGLAPEERAPR
ncbi:MAG TPA: monovalent cation/H(+) antiporter subunit G [Solirubrobacteraceae bacterium]